MAHLVKSTPKSSLISGIALGVFLGLGLAFSRAIRCYALIALPGLFSSKGRFALTVLVMVFIVTGPIRNFEKNELAVSASLTCGQEMIGNLTRSAMKQATNPATGKVPRTKWHRSEGCLSTESEIATTCNFGGKLMHTAMFWAQKVVMPLWAVSVTEDHILYFQKTKKSKKVKQHAKPSGGFFPQLNCLAGWFRICDCIIRNCIPKWYPRWQQECSIILGLCHFT